MSGLPPVYSRKLPEKRSWNNLKDGQDHAEVGEPVDVELLDVAEDVHVEAHGADKAE